MSEQRCSEHDLCQIDKEAKGLRPQLSDRLSIHLEALSAKPHDFNQ